MMNTRCAVCDNTRQCWIVDDEERCAECIAFINQGARGPLIRGGRVQIALGA